jgi:LysR family transcriptional regulator of beta-lactamase
MFRRELNTGALVQPFPLSVDVGAYWLTRLISRAPTQAMAAFKDWLTACCSEENQAGRAEA